MTLQQNCVLAICACCMAMFGPFIFLEGRIDDSRIEGWFSASGFDTNRWSAFVTKFCKKFLAISSAPTSHKSREIGEDMYSCIYSTNNWNYAYHLLCVSAYRG